MVIPVLMSICSPLQYTISSASAMETLGASLAKACEVRSVLIFLQGDLGVGKTTFVRGFLRALGHTGSVKSPTFSLLETYEVGARKILHFDLYRLNKPTDFEAIAGDDFFNPHNTCLIEWPDKAQGAIRDCDIECVFTQKDDLRKVLITAKNFHES